MKAQPTVLSVILGTADRKTAAHVATTYVTNDQGWTTAKVTGMLQDEYDVYTVRLDVERGRNAKVAVLQVEWNGRTFEVTMDALDASDYDERASTPATCSYCGRSTTQDRIVQHVCRTCYRNGIEA